MKNLLLPNLFRLIGWIVFVPSLLWGMMRYIGVVEMTSLPLDRLAIVLIALGSILIVASKERVEDEMTRAIRYASLLNSLYIYIVLVVISAITLDADDFHQFIIINTVLLPIIFVSVFALEMHRYYKMSRDEE